MKEQHLQKHHSPPHPTQRPASPTQHLKSHHKLPILPTITPTSTYTSPDPYLSKDHSKASNQTEKPWSPQEHLKLVALVKEKGPRWPQIAEYFEQREEEEIKRRCLGELGKVTEKIMFRSKRKSKLDIKKLIDESSNEKPENPQVVHRARELIGRMLLFEHSRSEEKSVNFEKFEGYDKERTILLKQFKKVIKKLKVPSSPRSNFSKEDDSQKGYSSDCSSIFEENVAEPRSMSKLLIEEEELESASNCMKSSDPIILEEESEIKALLMSEGLLAFENSQEHFCQIPIEYEMSDNELHNESYQRFYQQDELRDSPFFNTLTGSNPSSSQGLNQFN